ncbi:MAG: hypothetical protein OXU81_02845 [Gammaproteobacteria bacterium]|nr:hypothetical protein [Gammaproteobacteria bacterium]
MRQVRGRKNDRKRSLFRQDAASADRDQFATKADLGELRADLYRALWIQGGAIVAILTALRFLPI